jgi:hypothetical protein
VSTGGGQAVAGDSNGAGRGGLTPEGRERLRQAARRHRPWRYATGPRTAEGKAKVALNGKARQLGPVSVRELRAQLAELRVLARDMRVARGLAQPTRSTHG